jgi:hypothetical protein
VYFVLGGWLTFLALRIPEVPHTTVIARETAQANGPRLSDMPQTTTEVGPAGIIEITQIPFSHPDGVFPDRSDRLRPDRWVFAGFSGEQLKSFLASCDLRPAERNLLLDRAHWSATPSNCVVFPPPELIWSLSPRARQQVYSLLAKNSENYPQCYPFRFLLGHLDESFKASGLPQTTVEKVRQLTYTNNEYLCFADLEAVQNAIKPDELNNLIETLCAVPAFLLRLHVAEDSNIDQLIRYWGKGGREKLIAPMLNSLARVPGGGWINISYLLPPYARLRLYTYPDGWNDRSAPLQDCTFTALNFFNDTPDQRLFDMAYREKFLNSAYGVVNDEPTFGDLVTLLDPKNQIFHACVYIADGFVFTKNGINPDQPWILMKISDMLAIYDNVQKSPRVQFLRRKPGSNSVTSAGSRASARSG